MSLTITERKILAAKLLEQSRWEDLKLLASKNRLPAGDVLNHLKLTIKNALQRKYLQRLYTILVFHH